MLVMQRPTVEPDHRGGRQPPAVRHRPPRPRFRSHPRQLAAAHPPVVHPRRGHHAGAVRRRAARVRHHPRVVEDVTDIILNLKDIVLVSHSDEPVTLRLDVRGPADIGARDIQLTSDIEILNEDLHLATLNKPAASRSTSPCRRAAATARPTATRCPRPSA